MYGQQPDHWCLKLPLKNVMYLFLQLRWYTSPGRKGFLSDFIDNIKQDLNKSKEMKENVKKFREEARKLEESDALQQARRKFVSFLASMRGFVLCRFKNLC